MPQQNTHLADSHPVRCQIALPGTPRYEHRHAHVYGSLGPQRARLELSPRRGRVCASLCTRQLAMWLHVYARRPRGAARRKDAAEARPRHEEVVSVGSEVCGGE
jgi:hypothetical protein